jgi:hypothetical protein
LGSKTIDGGIYSRLDAYGAFGIFQHGRRISRTRQNPYRKKREGREKLHFINPVPWTRLPNAGMASFGRAVPGVADDTPGRNARRASPTSWRTPCPCGDTYHELATHYWTVVIPARPYKPRDKAKVLVTSQ